MKYDVSELAKIGGCKIVVVNEPKTAAEIEKAVLENNSKYRSGIHEAFSSYKKIGPFRVKNKKNLWDVLSKTKFAKDNGADYLMKMIKDAGMYQYTDRGIAALGTSQKKRASIVFNALNDESNFVINDCSFITVNGEVSREFQNGSSFEIVSWLKAYEYVFGQWLDVIWITDLPSWKIIHIIGDEAFASDYYSTHILVDNKLKSIPKDTFDKNFRRRINAKKAFEEARIYDNFLGLKALDPNAADCGKALPLYRSAAEGGNAAAQYAVGFFYKMGLGGCPVDEEKALYWHILSAYNDEYDEATADNVEKQFHQDAITSLKYLVVRVPNGKEILRKHIGDRAEDFYNAAKQEIDHEAKIKAAADALLKSTDFESWRQDFKKIKEMLEQD